MVVASGSRVAQAGFGFRAHFRPVLDGSRDAATILDVVVEGLRRLSVRELHLGTVPEDDPAFRTLEWAFRRGGYHVSD